MPQAPIPSTVRQIAGTAMGATLLPAAWPTNGMRFCARNPPRLPALLIAPIAAAPRGPLQRRAGSDQKHGISREMQGVPMETATKRAQLDETIVLAKKLTNPTSARTDILETTSSSRLRSSGSEDSAIAAVAHGIALSSPFWLPVTPKL